MLRELCLYACELHETSICALSVLLSLSCNLLFIFFILRIKLLFTAFAHLAFTYLCLPCLLI